jgi:hypothetical protein
METSEPDEFVNLTDYLILQAKMSQTSEPGFFECQRIIS